MVARPMYVAHPPGVTQEEFSRLLLIRRETLDRACKRLSGADKFPVQWRWGWSAKLVILGRTKDSSLCARIHVRGPEPSQRWTRSVRLVTARRLDLDFRVGVARRS